MMSGRSRDIQTGGICTWQLPADRSCAPVARSLLQRTMAELGLPSELIEDGELAVSELGTNAYQHAGRSHPVDPIVAAELWVWARTCPVPQLVVSVFDADRAALPRIGSVGLLEEHGKGLSIVAAVSACWGSHPSRCRLGNWLVAGKATWFALSLPACWPGADRIIASSVAARDLIDALAVCGIDARCRSDDKSISVVQVNGLNVWVGPKTFSWQGRNGGYVHHPLVDLQDAAEQIVRIHEESDPRGWPPPSSPYARQHL
jgi:hypothetical protein